MPHKIYQCCDSNRCSCGDSQKYGENSIFNSMESVKPVGGLVTTIKANSEIRLKDSNYVVRNVGLYPIKIHIYLKD